MKQINDLIICEIPKGLQGLQLRRNLLVTPKNSIRWASVWNIIEELPSGYEYEVIGCYSMIGLLHRNEILECAGIVRSIFDVKASFYSFCQAHELKPTDTTDLLFIKRIKK